MLTNVEILHLHFKNIKASLISVALSSQMNVYEILVLWYIVVRVRTFLKIQRSCNHPIYIYETLAGTGFEPVTLRL